jgi:hypothetical protein
MKQIVFSLSGKRPAPFIWWVVNLWLLLLAVGCRRTESLTVPADFQQLVSVDLSTQAYNEEILAEFTLTETAVTNIIYLLPNVNTPYFDLSLNGPGNDSLLILHSENYHTDASGGGIWEQTLTPGKYRLALTTEPSSGILSVYWGKP